jgi:hypothetical protein
MKTWLVSAATLLLLIGAAFVGPPAMRAHRLAEDEKLLRASPERLDPRVRSRFIALVRGKKWEEAARLSERMRPLADVDPEVLLYAARADLELGDVDRARGKVRQAKERFRREPQLRIQLETGDPELFWKIGYLLREPGA